MNEKLQWRGARTGRFGVNRALGRGREGSKGRGAGQAEEGGAPLAPHEVLFRLEDPPDDRGARVWSTSHTKRRRRPVTWSAVAWLASGGVCIDMIIFTENG